MAANDSIWFEGEVELFQSSGTTPTVRWFEGEVLVVHEYASSTAVTKVFNEIVSKLEE
jgi:hypothetical protein